MSEAAEHRSGDQAEQHPPFHRPVDAAQVVTGVRTRERQRPQTGGGSVFVDAPEVERIFERRVILNVDSGTEFEAWSGSAGPVAAGAAQPVSWFKRLLGR